MCRCGRKSVVRGLTPKDKREEAAAIALSQTRTFRTAYRYNPLLKRWEHWGVGWAPSAPLGWHPSKVLEKHSQRSVYATRFVHDTRRQLLTFEETWAEPEGEY